MATDPGMSNPIYQSPEYADQYAQIQRQRALSQALLRGGMEPLQTSYVPQAGIGSRPVPISPLQGIAKMLQAALGGYKGQQADEMQADMGRKMQASAQQWMQNAPQDKPGVDAVAPLGAIGGDTADTTPQRLTQEINQPEGAAAVPAQPTSMQAKLMHALQGQQNPLTAGIAGKQADMLMNQQATTDALKQFQGMSQQPSFNPNPQLTGQEVPGGMSGDFKTNFESAATIHDPNERVAALKQLMEQFTKAQAGNPNPIADLNPLALSPIPQVAAIGKQMQEFQNKQKLQQTMIDAQGARQQTGIAAADARQDKNIANKNLIAGIGADGTPTSDSETVAQGIASGAIAPLSSFAMRTPRGQQIMGRVLEINPNFRSGDYTRNIAGENAFTQGKQGLAIKSFNAAVSHLDTLGTAVDALQNGELPLFNKAANRISTEMGGTAPGNFDAVKMIVGKEIVKAIVGGGGGVGEREAAENSINNAKTPQQLKDIIQQYKTLMSGQLDAFRTEYNAIPNHGDFNRFLSAESKPAASAGAHPANIQSLLDKYK